MTGAAHSQSELPAFGHEVAVLAYAAGIVDGEGTITVVATTNPKTGTLGISCRVMVANSYQPLILWLVERLGGKISVARRTRKENHKPVYTWYLTARSAVRVCEILLPYLVVKRRQAEIILAVSKLRHHYGSGGTHGRRVASDVAAARVPLIAELRRLNQRGLVAA